MSENRMIKKMFSFNPSTILTKCDISKFGVSFHGFTDLRTGRSSPCVTRELPETIPNSGHSEWPHFEGLKGSRWRRHFGGTGGGKEEETEDLTWSLEQALYLRTRNPVASFGEISWNREPFELKRVLETPETITFRIQGQGRLRCSLRKHSVFFRSWV